MLLTFCLYLCPFTAENREEESVAIVLFVNHCGLVPSV